MCWSLSHWHRSEHWGQGSQTSVRVSESCTHTHVHTHACTVHRTCAHVLTCVCTRAHMCVHTHSAVDSSRGSRSPRQGPRLRGVPLEHPLRYTCGSRVALGPSCPRALAQRQKPSDDLTYFLFLKLPAFLVDAPRRSLTARVTASFIIRTGTLVRAKEGSWRHLPAARCTGLPYLLPAAEAWRVRVLGRAPSVRETRASGPVILPLIHSFTPTPSHWPTPGVGGLDSTEESPPLSYRRGKRDF